MRGTSMYRKISIENERLIYGISDALFVIMGTIKEERF